MLTVCFQINCRKKKLTDHWRRFIHPLRWRCQWLELQIKEFQSQAVKYDKLAEYEHQKHLAFDKVISEGCNSKSLAFSGQVQRNNILKRKRRKKVEQTVDLPSYISNHNLFSHYGKVLEDYTKFAFDDRIYIKLNTLFLVLFFWFTCAVQRPTADSVLAKDQRSNQGIE